MRRLLPFSALAALVLGAAGSAGCLDMFIPYQPQAAPDMAQPTSNSNSNTTSGTGDGGATLGDPNCIAPGTPSIDGHHNAGMPCLNCHDGNTAGANKFYAAGTLYDAAGNGLPGVTIELTDANNNKVTVVTASQAQPGNFWTDQLLTFPVRVRASSCPYDRPMSTQLAQGDGNCARSGCHDPNMRIHVP
jgi:hypothetical protein